MTNLNSLFDPLLNEIFSYLTLIDRIRCELVCRRWRSILIERSQKVIKLCFESKSNLTRSICTDRTHNPTTNDVFYFDENYSIQTINRMNQLFRKFNKIKSVHLQVKDIKLLKKANILTCLSKYGNKLEHLEIHSFDGPFQRDDLQLIFKDYSKSLRHLLITFQFDDKILNRKTIMKFLEICIHLELFYWRAPFLDEQNLQYVPMKLCSLFLIDSSLDLESISLIAQVNSSIFKHLKLARITSEHLNCITSNLLSLQWLSIDSLIQMNDLTILGQIRQLNRLQVLRFCLDINDQQINQIDNEMISIIKGCNQMKKVHIENAILTDLSLTFVSKYWKNLESFKLYSVFDENSQITDLSLIQFIALKRLQTLALPNFLLSKHLLKQLVDHPYFTYLNLREACSFVDDLFYCMLAKSTKANYNKYKLKINDEELFIDLCSINRPTNFEFKRAKIFNFDLF